MGRIGDIVKYVIATVIKGNDIVIGSDPDQAYKTKNYSMDGIRAFVLNGTSPDSNMIISSAGFELVGQTLTLFAGWVWRINGVEYTNEDDVIIVIPFAADDMLRIDTIIANASSTFVRVAGVESEDNPVAPDLPLSTLQVTFVTVTDGTISEPSDPDIGNLYIPKKEKKIQYFDSLPVDNIIQVAGSCNIYLYDKVEEIVGVELTDPTPNFDYDGKEFIFINGGYRTVTFKHEDPSADLQFHLASGIDFLLIPENSIRFLYDPENNRFIQITERVDDENNRITASTGFGLVGQDLTLNAGWEWYIDGDFYTNSTSVVINIPFASAGLQRIDLIVADTNNTFVRVAGTESASNPSAPDLPADTLQVTFITVTDGTIDPPVDPIIVDDFRKKIEEFEVGGALTGNVLSIDMLTESSSLRITGNALTLHSLNLTSGYKQYSGKRLLIKNFQVVSLTLKHLSGVGTGTHQFFFPNLADYDIQPNEIVEFALSTAAGRFEFISQRNLVSGTTIKTVDSQTLLGSGDVVSKTLPKTKTLLSTALATQDVAGMVIYINALSPVLVVAQNEVYDFIVTDTGQNFRLYLNGRSFGVGQPAITSTDVVEVTNKQLIIQGIGGGTKFTQAATNNYPFLGAAINSGGITAGFNSTPYIVNSHANGYLLMHTGAAGSNRGYRFRDGVDSPAILSKGLTFFGVLMPYTITDITTRIGFPHTGTFTANVENLTSGAWFNIVNGTLTARTASLGASSSGSSVAITNQEWLLMMIEVIDNTGATREIKFKVTKTDGTVVYNESITTTIQSSAGSSQNGTGIITTKGTAAALEYIFGISYMGFWAQKPNFLKYF